MSLPFKVEQNQAKNNILYLTIKCMYFERERERLSIKNIVQAKFEWLWPPIVSLQALSSICFGQKIRAQQRAETTLRASRKFSAKV